MEISIPSDNIQYLLKDSNEVINSPRLQSQISKVNELLVVIKKRNAFRNDQNVLNSILKYFPNVEHRNTIQSFINTLNHKQIDHGDFENVYGMLR